MRCAIFDLDGTLADTSADLLAAANAALPAPVLDLTADKAVAFRGGRAMLKLGHERLQTAVDLEAAYQAFLKIYKDRIDHATTIYPGVEAALDHLAATGWQLGVCTNKPAALAEELLTRLKLRSRFRALLGADSLAVRKPDPLHLTTTIDACGGRPERAALIGDTVTDREAARAAGVVSVLVTFGPEGNAVAALEPEGLLDDYRDLPALLDRLVD